MTVRFATPLPPWAIAALALAIVALAAAAYRKAGLPPGRRALLMTLRTAALALVVLCLLRPVVPVARGADQGGVVAVLVDASRSMGLRDAGGLTRIERAGALVARTIEPALCGRWRAEKLLFGDSLQPAADVALAATANRSDLGHAVRAAVDRFRDRGLAGIVIVSDGGDTSGADLARVGSEAGVPIVTVGVGSVDPVDREIRSIAAGQSALDASLIDLSVTAAVRGSEGPLELRLLQNGRVVERRQLRKAAEGAPVRSVFTVAPDRTSPTVFTAELTVAADELTDGNNTVSVLVPPPGRRRKVLVVEGAPGFEHTFLKRAWAQDPSLEVDSVVRKGRNDQGADTFFVQAAGGRGDALSTGYPATKAALFVYDAVVLANVDPHTLAREQMEWLRAFVSERGGGLLVLGSRTLGAPALAGSPLEELLPLRPGDGNAVMRASATRGGERVVPTPDGASHPLMRIGATDEESRKRWAALPALAGHVPLGEPRPGASVLAVANDTPVVAVQRFGAGRVLVFAGEASWRWRMMMPATDQTYERFWRQAARWLAVDAPPQVALSVPQAPMVGEDVELAVLVRDGDFAPAADAQVQITVQLPNGREQELVPTLVDPGRGRFVARLRAAERGVYRAQIEATRGGTELGSAEGRWLTGGLDRELVDPRLNESALRRLAESSGGRYLAAEQAGDVASWLVPRPRTDAPVEWRDAWHTGWVFVLVVAIVGLEWGLRRRWGLR